MSNLRSLNWLEACSAAMITSSFPPHLSGNRVENFLYLSSYFHWGNNRSVKARILRLHPEMVPTAYPPTYGYKSKANVTHANFTHANITQEFVTTHLNSS